MCYERDVIYGITCTECKETLYTFRHRVRVYVYTIEELQK